MTTPIKPDFSAVDALTAGVPAKKQAPPPAKPKPNPVQSALGSEPLPGALSLPAAPPPQKPTLNPAQRFVPSFNGPPHPVLQARGFPGSVPDLNDRVQAVTDAYQRAHNGAPPPARLALDVATSPVPTEGIGRLFAPQLQSPGAARAYAAARTVTHPDPTPDDLPRVVAHATASNQFDSWFGANHDLLDQALTDPSYRSEIGDAAVSGRMLQIRAVLDAAAAGKIPPIEAHDRLQAMGFIPGGTPQSAYVNARKGLGLAGRIMMDGFFGFAQVAGGLTLGPPTLVYTEGKAAVESAKQRSLKPLGAANKQLAVQTGKGFVQDFRDPERNAGNLFLDIIGITALGAGAAARVAAGGRAALAGESALDISKALVKRPTPGTFTLHRGDANANISLSENTAVRQVQKLLLNRIQKLNDNHFVPAPALGSVLDAEAVAQLDELRRPFGAQLADRLMRAQWRTQDRTAAAVRTSAMEPMIQAGHWSVRLGNLLPRIDTALSVGEQKALQVLLTDVEGGPLEQLRVNREFHRRMIDMNVGDPAAHEAQLGALKLAEKVLTGKPRPAFVNALAETSNLIDTMEALKADALGLSPEVAESRVARVGAILRGETLTEPAHLSDPALAAKIGKLEQGLADNLAAQEGYRAAPRSAERAVGGPVKGEKPDATLRALRVTESRLRTQIDDLRGQTATIELQRVNPESRYLPYQDVTRAPRKGARINMWSPRSGPFGIPVPGSDPSLSHEFTGHYVKAGTFRIDATGLAGESYAKAVKAATTLNAWQRLWDAGEPYRKGYLPIRDARTISDNLRRAVAKSDLEPLTAEDMALLEPGEGQTLQRLLFPDQSELTTADMQHVRWVPKTLVEDQRLPVQPHLFKRIAQNANGFARDTILYAKLSYALNAINSAENLAIHQGLFAPPNFLRAMSASKLYGGETARMLDALAGEGRSLSYVPDMGKATRISQGMARAWNRITDQIFRRAAVIHELHRRGIADAEIPTVLKDYAKDPNAHPEVAEAGQRARAAMVDMTNLTWFEKNSLRHYVFVYPWTSRSFVWSLRTIIDRPIQSAILAEIGKDTEQKLPALLKHLPRYMKEFGYMPVGWTRDGKPKMVNPGSVNTFATLAEAAGLMSGKDTLESLLGPIAGLAVHAVTNRDQYGRQYKIPYVGPIVDQLTGLPQYAALTRALQTNGADLPLDVADPNALVTRQNATMRGATKRPVFVPEGWAALWSLAEGGLHPRVLDPQAVEARFWRDQPADKRHAHEKQLLDKMIKIQAAIIGEKPQPAILDAVNFNSDRDWRYKQFATEHGRAPTTKERAQMTVDLLAQQGRVNAKTATMLRTNLDRQPSDEIAHWHAGVLNHYAGGSDYRQFHHDVSVVASFDPPHFGDTLSRAVKLGLVPQNFADAGKAPTEALRAYGRKYLAYDRRIQQLSAKVRTAQTAQEKADAAGEIQLEIAQNDKTLTINGHVFPSLARMAVAKLSPPALRAHIDALPTRDYADLSSIDKQLLGRKLPAGALWPELTTAWGAYKYNVGSFGRKSIPDNQNTRMQVVTQLDAHYRLHGAFVADYRFSQLPRFKQIPQLNIYRDSTNKADWNALLSSAAAEYKAVHVNKTTSHDAAMADLQTFAEQLVPWVKENRPGFYHELQPYLQQNPSFVYDLLRF